MYLINFSLVAGTLIVGFCVWQGLVRLPENNGPYGLLEFASEPLLATVPVRSVAGLDVGSLDAMDSASAPIWTLIAAGYNYGRPVFYWRF